MKRSTIYGLIILFISGCVNATSWEDSPAVNKIFTEANVEGTFVVYDVAENRFVGHSYSRAQQRFVPASTFKIPNTLIGLSVGAVVDVDEVLPYGGKSQAFNAWERDMGLREAIKISNVPIYQELARRITLSHMSENVQTLNYGNADIGSTVDNFWLIGPLKISAIEQTEFLAKLVQGILPYSKHTQEQVREIVLLEQSENWSLYGKTGWVNAPNPGVGWWVGWVVKEDKIFSFALNIDIFTKADADKRLKIGRASLHALDLL
jgi:beta-lactamase class D